VSALKGIEVVVPIRINKNRALLMAKKLVRDKEAWLKKTLKRLNFDSTTTPLACIDLPQTLNLKAIQQPLNLVYIAQKTSTAVVNRENDTIKVRGIISERIILLKALENYLKALAKDYFGYRLDYYSQKYQLNYNRLTIRGQKTRWGSCSSKKNISLNYKLLFIEKELANYVILHELAHTKHLNHSVLFWETLEEICPNAKLLDKQLYDSTADIPEWVIRLRS